MSEERFISRQISKYATTKKLIEFNDKMRLPPVEYYAHVQATGDKNHEGKNVTSLIGITMLDYSNGTGDKTVSVEANITPDELMYIFSKLNQGVEKFEMSQDKIFGEPDEKGKCSVTKLKIIRATVDTAGKPRNYPWFIQIENGKGIKAVNSTSGGSYIQPKSYVEESKVSININDFDLFKLLSRVQSFITAWELTYAPQRIRQAKEIVFNNTKEGTGK